VLVDVVGKNRARVVFEKTWAWTVVVWGRT
jgi:hypothetical protein